MVSIQLAGGNDGLHTIIPYRNDVFFKSRPKLSISKERLIKVTDDIGFHSNLAPLKNLYDQGGNLTVINNVGYPNPIRSHFRSTDIWQSGSNSNEYLTTGWLGRYIDNFGKAPYTGIDLDDSLSLILKGEKINGIATKKLYF